MARDLHAPFVVTVRAASALIRGAKRVSERAATSLERSREGWFTAPYDPAALREAFPALRLRMGYRLAAYQFLSGGNGNGFVFVIPVGHSLPDPPPTGFEFDWAASGQARLSAEDTALPDWVRPDIESFLEGDGSPLSYFQASMFSREVRELGARWHGCSWSTHEMLLSARQVSRRHWDWVGKQPQEWRPTVRHDSSGEWEVTFHTHTGLGQERLIRHRDRFATGYILVSDEEVLATGKGGYIF